MFRFLQGNSDALGFKLKPTTSFMFAEIIGFADLNSNAKFCTTLINLKLLFIIHNYPSLIKFLRVVKKWTVSAKHTHTLFFSHMRLMLLVIVDFVVSVAPHLAKLS